MVYYRWANFFKGGFKYESANLLLISLIPFAALAQLQLLLCA